MALALLYKNLYISDMKVTTYSDLRQNLASMLDGVENDHEPLLVTRSNGRHAVVMSLEDFNAYQETLYLASGKANADRLNDSIAQARSGQVVSLPLADLEKMAE